MKEEIFKFKFDVESFEELVMTIVKRELELFANEHFKPQKKEYLTRKEVSELLKVSLVTLNYWCKNGLLRSYRIGNRVRFKSAEIEAALKEVKTLKYRRQI
jgi:excisionase family DNA binding protein